MIEKDISLILACTVDGGIGRCNDLPWYIPSEMKKFKAITTAVKNHDNMNAVIMGRKTWESILKPLNKRMNIVISSDRNFKAKYDNVIVMHSLNAALHFCNKPYIENIFIIGGAELYNKFLNDKTYYDILEKVYLSIIFYSKSDYTIDKYINIESLFRHFDWIKDKNYQKECEERLFASYVCYPHYRSAWHRNDSM